MSLHAAHRALRVFAPVLCVGLLAYCANHGEGNVCADWAASPWAPAAFALGVVALFAARLGRLESLLITVLPLILGVGVLLAVRAGLGLVAAEPGRLGFGSGALLGAFHALGLTTWCLEAWRGRGPSSTALPFAGAALALLGFLTLSAVQHPYLAAVGTEGLLAYGCLALIAQALVPAGWGLLLRHRGVNGTPSLRHMFAGLWVVWTLAGRGLWFLLTDRSEGRAERRLAASDAVHRIALIVRDRMPLGQRLYPHEDLSRFNTPGIVVANHTSMYDIGAILALPVPMTVLIKGWVSRAPVMGRMTLAAGYINIEGLTPEQVTERARTELAFGVSVLIFPEGSRSHGRIGRFHNGAFAIARALDVPVIPVALAGTMHLARSGTWWLGDHDSRVSVLEPMNPRDFTGELADKRMARAARDRIRAEVRRLTPETQRGPNWYLPLAGLYRYLGEIVSHYAASKARRDPLVEAIPDLCPGEGLVLHAGCGYGILSARLALGQPWREIRGIDSDPRKIRIARAALGDSTGARFEVGDLRDADLGRPETVLLVDVLHYWPPDVQATLVRRLADATPPGARLVFREGIQDAEGHGLIQFGERLALALGFTRAGQGLFFQTEAEYRALFEDAGFAVSFARPELGLSSNLVLVCTRRDDAPEDA